MANMRNPALLKQPSISKEFPKLITTERIKQEYNTLVRDTKTIIVFGRPRYQKCNIISAVLQDNYCSKLPPAAQKDRPRRSSKEIKGTMIHSQYEIHDPQSGISTVVT